MQEYEDKFYEIYHEDIDHLYSELKEWVECDFDRVYLLDLMNPRNFFEFCVKYSELYVEEYEEEIHCEEYDTLEEVDNVPARETKLVLKKIEKPKEKENVIKKHRQKWWVPRGRRP